MQHTNHGESALRSQVLSERHEDWVSLPLLLFLPRPSLSITSSAHCIRFLLRTPVSAPRRRNTGCRTCTSGGACVCVCEAVAAIAERANSPEGGGARDDVVAAAMFEI
jgi:hypothetical protein